MYTGNLRDGKKQKSTRAAAKKVRHRKAYPGAVGNPTL
jgi:hypothetical protein